MGCGLWVVGCERNSRQRLVKKVMGCERNGGQQSAVSVGLSEPGFTGFMDVQDEGRIGVRNPSHWETQECYREIGGVENLSHREAQCFEEF